MLPSDFKRRVKAYVEVAIISVLWFAFAGGLGVAASYLWKVLVGDPAGDTALAWPIVVAFLAVFLLPYLVVAAGIWNVNLSIFGARAEQTRAQVIAETAGEVIEPSGSVI